MVYWFIESKPKKSNGKRDTVNPETIPDNGFGLRGETERFRPPVGKSEDMPALDDDRGTGPAIRCRNCRHRITTGDRRKSMNGSHRHVFNNPTGIFFEIALFDAAEGCATAGRPTMEFTWFAGYAWRFALCGHCGIHLGWLYTGSGEGGFFGLILERIVEDPGESSRH